MSTNLTTPSQLMPFVQDGQLPAYLQDGGYQSTLDNQATGTSVDRITVVDGAIVTDIGGVRSSPSLAIDVVVLDAHPVGRETYRAYYEGQYKDGESSPPACFSADGKYPSPNAEKPQSHDCASCPMNISGSGSNGEGRACGYFKHVAVAVYPELDRVFRLKVASRSLFSKELNGVPSPLGGNAWGFTNFAKLLQQTKTPWEAVVTRVSLPKGQTYGFFFTPVGYVNKEQFEKIKELQRSAVMEDVLTVEVSGTPAQTNPAGFLPAGAPAVPPVPPLAPPAPTGREKWMASPTLPSAVKDWIVQVDDNTARTYLQANYPHEV